MKLFKSLLLAAALALPVTLPAAAKEYRLLSSWDSNYPYNPYILDPFIKGIKEATGDRVNIKVSGPETVPPFEQLEPVGSGVFQFLFSHGAYHFGTTPIAMITDAFKGDLQKSRAAGVKEELDKFYNKYNLKVVALPITPEGAYQIILRKPVGDSGGLEGRKIRGSLTYKGVIEMLGGVLTVLPPSEIYTGLEKGVIDGAAWPAIGPLDYKWYEVAHYLLRPAFGVNAEPIFMNLDAWNALDKKDQQAIMEVSRKVEDSWYKDAPTVWKKEEDELKKRGMSVTEMGSKQKAELAKAWARGMWAQGEQKDPVGVKALHEFAVSKGLAD